MPYNIMVHLCPMYSCFFAKGKASREGKYIKMIIATTVHTRTPDNHDDACI